MHKQGVVAVIERDPVIEKFDSHSSPADKTAGSDRVSGAIPNPYYLMGGIQAFRRTPLVVRK